MSNTRRQDAFFLSRAWLSSSHYLSDLPFQAIFSTQSLCCFSCGRPRSCLWTMQLTKISDLPSNDLVTKVENRSTCEPLFLWRNIVSLISSSVLLSLLIRHGTVFRGHEGVQGCSRERAAVSTRAQHSPPQRIPRQAALPRRGREGDDRVDKV